MIFLVLLWGRGAKKATFHKSNMAKNALLVTISRKWIFLCLIYIAKVAEIRLWADSWLKNRHVNKFRHVSLHIAVVFAKFINLIHSSLYGARNLEMSIRFSLKSQPSERFHRPEMSQIKAEISLRTNVKLNFHKNVGCQWYQWIPDFCNIRFEQNNLTEKM